MFFYTILDDEDPEMLSYYNVDCAKGGLIYSVGGSYINAVIHLMCSPTTL